MSLSGESPHHSISSDDALLLDEEDDVDEIANDGNSKNISDNNLEGSDIVELDTSSHSVSYEISETSHNDSTGIDPVSKSSSLSLLSEMQIQQYENMINKKNKSGEEDETESIYSVEEISEGESETPKKKKREILAKDKSEIDEENLISDSDEDEENNDDDFADVQQIDVDEESDLVETVDSEDEIQSSKKINIFFSHGSLFVWNAEDVKVLREECRIVGKLTGCLPRAPHQNTMLGLPLELLPEEAKLLVDIDAAVVVEESSVTTEQEEIRAEAFKTMREMSTIIQQKLYREIRKEEIQRNMHKIIEGRKTKKRKVEEENESSKNADGPKGKNAKRSKIDTDSPAGTENIEISNKNNSSQSSNTESNQDTDKMGETQDTSMTRNGELSTRTVDRADKEEEDGENVEDLVADDFIKEDTDPKHSLVQLFTEMPWKQSVRPCTANWYQDSKQQTLRFKVFRNLWQKGYFLTSGSKFGGDYLVYPGDPSRFHSHFIAICKERHEDISSLELVTIGRLATTVRKCALLCSLDKRNQVTYTSLQWSGLG